MLFNSYSFVFLFAPIVYGLYWTLERQDHRKWVSLIASYIFYGVWDWKFAALMLATTSVDYFTAQKIEDAEAVRTRKAWLVASMVSNLGVLAVFKYFDFFASSVNAIAPRPIVPLLNTILPIGISFYTFESMSYTIDVYWKKTRALRRFLDYGHFVTMFPRLVAGPIARYADVADQLKRMPRRLDAATILEALQFFILGLAKKSLIADYLGTHLVDRTMTSTSSMQLASAWVTALGYAGQLYFDFSGYSDMAVGLALLLGFRLPRNFNLPYASTNVSEFWRRWHISLSTWLRDYLYIPLGGNRRHTVRNLMLTMVLGGLWHGANWTFVLWGTFHGIGLVLYNKRVVRAPWLPRWAAVGTTFVFVVVGWVMFRADSVRDALHVYRAMLGLNGLGLSWVSSHGSVVLATLIAIGLSMRLDTYDFKPAARPATAFALGCLAVLCAMRFAMASPFLYFQF